MHESLTDSTAPVKRTGTFSSPEEHLGEAFPLFFPNLDQGPSMIDPITVSVLDLIRRQDPQVADLIAKEGDRQEHTLELIASENHVSPAVMHAMGTCLTNKYAEGYPGARYYGGCVFHDQIEEIARERAKKLFGCLF